MRTWVLLRTESVKTESGPVWNSCFSRSSSSSGVKSAFGLFTREAISRQKVQNSDNNLEKRTDKDFDKV